MQATVRKHRGGTMKLIILALVAASAASVTAALCASAAPADGTAIARIGQQVDPAINVASKQRKRGSQTTAAKAACPADQTRSNRTGNCRPLTSEEK
jgi:hypothetical protein